MEQWEFLRQTVAQAGRRVLGQGIVYSDEGPPPSKIIPGEAEPDGKTGTRGDRFWLTLTPYGWLLCLLERPSASGSPNNDVMGTATVTLNGTVILGWMEQRSWSTSVLGTPPTVTPAILQSLVQQLLSPELPSAEALAIACPIPEQDRAWEQLHHGLIHRLVQGVNELPQVIHWALVQAQQLLGVDRVLIYQFQVPLQSLKLWRSSETPSGDRLWQRSPHRSPWEGLRDGVTYEALRDKTVPSVLYHEENFGILGLDHHGEIQPGVITDEGQGSAEGEASVARAQLSVTIAGQTVTGTMPWGMLATRTIDSQRQ